MRADFIRRFADESCRKIGLEYPTSHGQTTEPAEAEDIASNGRAMWCAADIKRAIAAAEEAGLRAYRIEITLDGTITIHVGEQSEGPVDDAADEEAASS